MSSWLVAQRQQREAVRAKAAEAENRAALKRVAAVRAAAEALAASHQGERAERDTLLTKCDADARAIRRAGAGSSVVNRAADLEARLDALRTHIVERAAEELEARELARQRAHEAARREVHEAVAEARRAQQRAPRDRREAAAHVHTTESSADLRVQKHLSVSAQTRARAEAAKRDLVAGLATLAACITALPHDDRPVVAAELERIGLLTGRDVWAAVDGLTKLQHKVRHMTAAASASQRERRQLVRRCASSLEAMTASLGANARPALAARAWDLRSRLAQTLADASPVDALKAIAEEVDSLAAESEEQIAADEARDTMDELVRALERAGYEVGHAEGGAFAAVSGADVGVRFESFDRATGEVKASAVRLTEASVVDGDSVCETVEATLAALAADPHIAWNLVEQCRHLPRPAPELTYVDPSSVAWRARRRPGTAAEQGVVRRMEAE